MRLPNILRIIRVHIVAGGALAFSLGALLALASGGSFDPVIVVLAYVVVLLGDLSAHYSNDYFDVEVDRHIEQKKFFAGSAILVNHPNLRSVSKSISISLLVCANILAIAIFLFLGAPIEIFHRHLRCEPCGVVLLRASDAFNFKRIRRGCCGVRNRLRDSQLRLFGGKRSI
jgi:1,4-dihydroxy-2-naphthoate polyprenyltransferase